MTNTKHLRLDVTATNGVPFRVVLLLDGKSDNFPAVGKWMGGGSPLVEFYDLRYRNVRGFTPDGQFVSRYYLEALVGRDERYGLDLQGDVPNWTIDAATMRTVAAWLYGHTTDSVSTWDELQEDKRVVVRNRLRKILITHYIARGDTSISLEAAADLLDIIEALKADVSTAVNIAAARPSTLRLHRRWLGNGPFSDADL